jgi:hypothetical protein
MVKMGEEERYITSSKQMKVGNRAARSLLLPLIKDSKKQGASRQKELCRHPYQGLWNQHMHFLIETNRASFKI